MVPSPHAPGSCLDCTRSSLNQLVVNPCTLAVPLCSLKLVLCLPSSKPLGGGPWTPSTAIYGKMFSYSRCFLSADRHRFPHQLQTPVFPKATRGYPKHTHSHQLRLFPSQTTEPHTFPPLPPLPSSYGLLAIHVLFLMPNIKSGPELALGSLLSSLKTPTPRAVHLQATQGSRLVHLICHFRHVRCFKPFNYSLVQHFR